MQDDNYPPGWSEGPELGPDEDLTDDLDDEPTEDAAVVDARLSDVELALAELADLLGGV